MVRRTCAVDLALAAQRVGGRGVASGGGERDRPIGRFDRLGKPSNFGVSSGQRAQRNRFPPARKLHAPLRQLGGLGPVSDRCLGPGGHCPRQPVHRVRIARLKADRLAPVNHRIGDSSLSFERRAKIAVDLRKIGPDLQRLLKLSDRGVELPTIGQNDAEVVVGVRGIRVKLDRLPVFDDCLDDQALLGQEIAEEDMRGRIVGLDLQRLSIVGGGGVQFVAAGQCHAQIVMD